MTGFEFAQRYRLVTDGPSVGLYIQSCWKRKSVSKWVNVPNSVNAHTNVSAESTQDFKAPQSSRKQWARLLGCTWGRVVWDQPCPGCGQVFGQVIMLACKCTYMFTLAEFQSLWFENCGVWRTVQLSCVCTSCLHPRGGICRQNSKLIVKSVILLHQNNVCK